MTHRTTSGGRSPSQNSRKYDVSPTYDTVVSNGEQTIHVSRATYDMVLIEPPIIFAEQAAIALVFIHDLNKSIR